jgi:heme/copper-type cytochrome/quinol oxidase subunit 2
VFHDRMLLVVRALSRADFDTWLAGHGSASPAASGAP